MIFIFRCWGRLSRTNTRRCSVSSSVQKRRRCLTLPTQLWTQKNSRLNQSSIFRAPCVCLSTPRVCSRFPSVSCPTSQSQGCSRSRCVSAFVLISLWSFFIRWSLFGICLFCIGDLSAGDHSWVFVLYCSQCLARLFAELLPKLMACLNDLTSLSHRWLGKKLMFNPYSIG